MLSPESSAEPGPWRTSRAPYQREMMDVIADPNVERVVFKTSAQVGKTELVNNLVGYWIHLDPGPLLVVQPNLDMARTWSSDRLEPMQRDTPVLASRIRLGRSKAGRATKLHKTFPGGHLTVVGANAAAGLASRPIRCVLFDEVDRFPASAGKEGDPIDLATKRTKTFHDRKILMVSTPTTTDLSRIQVAWTDSDQRIYEVPCPECGVFQRLEWANVRFDDDDPTTTRYQCSACSAALLEHHKREMLAGGKWRATNPESRTPGFHLSALYSPWTRWAEVVEAFIRARGDPLSLQVWTNTELGETWDDGERLEAASLEKRAEPYTAAPRDVRFVTMGVDVQDDRLEALTVGWGTGDESWVLQHRVIPGDPKEAGDRSWAELDAHRRAPVFNEDGVRLFVQALTVDSGYLADAVYTFCYARYADRVYATKGKGGQDIPIVYRRERRKKAPTKCPVFTIGTDASKDVIFGRLKRELEGPGYVHFPAALPREFFAQVTSEVKRVIYSLGRATIRYVKTRARNEALDLLVLNLAALHIERPLLVGPVRLPARPDGPIAAVPPPEPQLELELDDDAQPETAPAGVRRRNRGPGGWSLR